MTAKVVLVRGVLTACELSPGGPARDESARDAPHDLGWHHYLDHDYPGSKSCSR